MGEWRPISEAPRDGTAILLYGPDWMKVAMWSVVTNEWHSSTETTIRSATHWTELPPPPAEVKCSECGGNGNRMEFIPGGMGLRRSDKPCPKCSVALTKDNLAQSEDTQVSDGELGPAAPTLGDRFDQQEKFAASQMKETAASLETATREQASKDSNHDAGEDVSPTDDPNLSRLQRIEEVAKAIDRHTTDNATPYVPTELLNELHASLQQEQA